ncbi:MAG: Crp/Fnr family transcriptional regulator [Eubacteriales bacterium]|jgi:CRP/FNR family transcriptional regulator|nr:Crp/Fnr family transcriptional regulator [Eubacteriales bacterium]MDD3197619.1 Crp/Fnr family transcriptional regulator [Eubacteriales bacterium]MDD3504443.1 Crp/Fnr family transcriptional regulator [Eubacteriales bacterium]MDD4681856.1 Crp/Fnr family transcriptional regulator [Eubacteriales bacterium]
MITQDQITEIDSLFPVLKQLSQDNRDLLFSLGQIIELPVSQMLMQQNQQCQYLPLVLDGVLRVYKLSANGREMTLFRTGPGETCLVSIACQLRQEEFPALAQVEEAARLFMVPMPLYHEILDRQPVWKDFLILTLYEHLTETMETLEAVTFDRTDHRLINWLLEQTEGEKGVIKTTHEAIAIEIGTAREVVSRLLGEFKSQHTLALGRGRIEILDPNRLAAIKDGV